MRLQCIDASSITTSPALQHSLNGNGPVHVWVNSALAWMLCPHWLPPAFFLQPVWSHWDARCVLKNITPCWGLLWMWCKDTLFFSLLHDHHGQHTTQPEICYLSLVWIRNFTEHSIKQKTISEECRRFHPTCRMSWEREISSSGIYKCYINSLSSAAADF